jgi:hypothetical protein
MRCFPLSQLRVFGLFDKRFKGSDLLLRLASLRFRQAGLSAEFYAANPEKLEYLLSYKPSRNGPAVVHLSREIDLFKQDSRDQVLEFVDRFAGRIYGFIVHDQPEIPIRPTEYTNALEEIHSKLEREQNSPFIFIEYASGLDPAAFVEFHLRIKHLSNISACIDTGHVGLWQANALFAKNHPDRSLFSLKPDSPELPEYIGDIQKAVGTSLPTVLKMLEDLSVLKKPVHFHLHDGHPLSTSRFGVSDHLSFLTHIPIPIEYDGRKLLHPMYGPAGLSRIVKKALLLLGPEKVSFSLEIHPTEGKLPLGDASFQSSEDKENAERTNYWLSVLVSNYLLVSDYAAKYLEWEMCGQV